MNAAAGLLAFAFFSFCSVLAVAPLISGIIKKTKARFQHRRGAGLVQPYFDLAKLLRKEVVVPSASSWLFRERLRVLASTLVIALLVPMVWTPVPLHAWATSSPSSTFLALGGSSLLWPGSTPETHSGTRLQPRDVDCLHH